MNDVAAWSCTDSHGVVKTDLRIVEPYFYFYFDFI
jgi:hypothetical protein